MNKLIRPCKLWGETFDAIDVSDIIRNDKLENKKKFDFNVGLYFSQKPPFIIESPCVHTLEEQSALFQEAITTIAKALNPHIWVMDAVLDAVKKEPNAQYLILDKRDSPYFELALDVDEIKRGDYIQADCPLALKVLLNFYTDGTPVKGKETE